MSDKRRISVIVPVYRVEEYLDRCVRSITGQTYTELEILLIDDGSPDRCPEMCDTWARKDPRIRVIHKENGGLSDARNAGLAAASGTYIAFVDSDDWIGPEMLERLLFSMEKEKSDIAACAVMKVWDDGREELFTVRANTVLDRLEAQRALLYETLLKQPVWYKLYKREKISGIPFKTGKYHEDVYWSYQALGAAERVSLTGYTGYFYTQRAQSIMGKAYSLDRLDVLGALEERYAYFQKFFPELEREARLNILSVCIYHAQMALRYLEGSERKQAFRMLNDLKSRYSFTWKDSADLKASHRIWIQIGRHSLKTAARIRNILRIGL
jgi:glycosyltransferase involved in cell wall biosynthesis